jgi:hypothetical protein
VGIQLRANGSRKATRPAARNLVAFFLIQIFFWYEGTEWREFLSVILEIRRWAVILARAIQTLDCCEGMAL